MKRMIYLLIKYLLYIGVITILICLSRFSFDGSGSWGYGRYIQPNNIWFLEDTWYNIGVEPGTFFYETHFPYIYVIGEGGFTKIFEIPFVTYVEKYSNYDFHPLKFRPLEEKVSHSDDTLYDLKMAYGGSLILHTSYNQFSEKDRAIFKEMVNKYEKVADKNEIFRMQKSWSFLKNTVNKF